MGTEINLEIKLFAGLRERIGSPTLHVHCNPRTSAGDLKDLIAAICPDSKDLVRSSRVAVDRTFVDDARCLELSADQPVEIALIPPVSGG
ncbi:MAG: MoaD/ThiS family protein [Planctomycetota bacterium]|jgi:molybdopterin converting factor small subunit